MNFVLPYDGVLFDWSGTLVVDPEPGERLSWALRRLGRAHGSPDVDPLLARLASARLLPDVAAARSGYDCDARRHRAGQMLLFARAALDLELAEQLYSFDAHPENRPLFPDVPHVLKALHEAGIRVVVISDIHLDLRPLLARQGVGDLIDGYGLSFEEGVEKPDPRLFGVALSRLGTSAERTLMVGDLAAKDGGAANIGITTLILPRQSAHPDRPRLDPVLRIVNP